MARGLKNFTNEQLSANRKILTGIQYAFWAAIVAYLVLVGYWVATAKWDSGKSLSIVPMLGMVICVWPVRIQISAISKELDSRTKS